MMVDIKETIDGLTQELRRGTITIAVLSLLSEPQYGYSLVSILVAKGINSIRVRCTRFCAGWKSKGCWRASGIRMRHARASIIC